MDTTKKMPNSTIQPLQNGISLEVMHEGRSVFRSEGKWLYPLFELEIFLSTDPAGTSLNRESLVLHDKIGGRAAAALICRMGIVRCHIEILSRLALEVFEAHGVVCTYNRLVDRIKCHTEEIIHAGMGLDEIYRMLRRRAKLIEGIGLEITDLEAGYPGKTVLKDFSLSLGSGEQLVLTGDNGAGKTTLIKTIIGSIPIRKGSIRFGASGGSTGGAGGAPKSEDPDSSEGPGSSDGPGRSRANPKPRIGYVTQSAMNTPFPIATEEVVAMGLIGDHVHGEELRYQIEIAMRRTGCYHLYGRNFYTLSGGERQRVSLARCLCQKAGLILMDEPTSFLDAESKDDLREVLGHVIHHQMPTVLLVSHDHDWIEQLGWPVRRLEKGRLC